MPVTCINNEENKVSADSNVTEANNEINTSPKPDLNGTTYQNVKLACEYLLEKEGKTNQSNIYRGSELLEKLKTDFKQNFKDVADNTLSQYLSNTVRDTESRINCLGRRQGYYLVPSNIINEQSIDNNNSQPSNSCDIANRVSRLNRESLLYPVLEAWLIGQGYQAGNISTGKALGKWGNPDVAGINPLGAFNGFSVEVATIEAKTSINDWEKWIFEAISHRRFANRAYFAFAHQSETISKIPKDMRYYAELYDIGVLVISVENTRYDELMNGENIGELASGDVEIIELYSAPYNFVQPKYQLQFCEALGIGNIQKLYQWGNNA